MATNMHLPTLSVVFTISLAVTTASFAKTPSADIRWTADVPSRLKEIREVRSELQSKIEDLAQSNSDNDSHARVRKLRTLENYYGNLR